MTKGCRKDWIRFAGACYILSTTRVSGKSWGITQKYRCQSKTFNGTHPVSIHSPEEQKFIYNKFRRGGIRIWLGLFGLLQWTDGTPLTYTYWEKGFTPWKNGVAYLTTIGDWATHRAYGPLLGYYVCKYLLKGNNGLIIIISSKFVTFSKTLLF